VLVGHDWGGWAGWFAAVEHADRLDGYVAAGIAHPWPSPSTMLRTLPRLAYQPPIAMPVLGPRVVSRSVAALLRGAWGDRATYDRGAEEIFAERYRQAGRAEAASRYYRDFLVRERGAGPRGRLGVPTRLLFGAEDFLGARVAEGLERHGDDARTILLEGCGHFVAEERPEAVAAAVREVRAAGQ
jgi:pimeloyl-ACP methyl ester carboxylesterase